MLQLSVVGALATASVAFAQSEVLVDPWTTLTAPSGAGDASGERLAEPEANPDAVPELAPESDSPATPLPKPGASTPWPEVVDIANPWHETTGQAATSASLEATAKPALSTQRQVKGSWARPIADIVDPWEAPETSGWVPQLDLVVDPWSTSSGATK